MSEASREMSLGEWVDTLPKHHRARGELTALCDAAKQWHTTENIIPECEHFPSSKLLVERDELRDKIAQFCHGEDHPDQYVTKQEASELRAANDKLRELLHEIEWSGGTCCNYCRRTTGYYHKPGVGHCPSCELAQTYGHAQDCALAALKGGG